MEEGSTKIATFGDVTISGNLCENETTSTCTATQVTQLIQQDDGLRGVDDVELEPKQVNGCPMPTLPSLVTEFFPSVFGCGTPS